MNSSELEFGIYRYEMQKGVVVIVPVYLRSLQIYIHAYNATRVRLLCVKYNSQRIKQFATILDGVPTSLHLPVCAYIRIQYVAWF